MQSTLLVNKRWKNLTIESSKATFLHLKEEAKLIYSDFDYDIQEQQLETLPGIQSSIHLMQESLISQLNALPEDKLISIKPIYESKNYGDFITSTFLLLDLEKINQLPDSNVKNTRFVKVFNQLHSIHSFTRLKKFISLKLIQTFPTLGAVHAFAKKTSIRKTFSGCI